ncbi:hypothetical protein NQ317_010174 [Molorchus minor]|uniref:DDE Tnp4 domain-containing protein n=1 Tax=Molorchus minor TaxID=1323400 RepID=A0ABQ9IS96_9CUCU|nr:hypothetical protein NQ317_010174 [Molorchus minor]
MDIFLLRLVKYNSDQARPCSPSVILNAPTQVFDSNLKIINVIARYPGSNNDAFIWNNCNLQDFLKTNGHIDYLLLGDSKYSQRTWFMTPVKVTFNLDLQSMNILLHIRIRSTIERCSGVSKMKFRCLLKHRVLHFSSDVACDIIKACILLHNICVEYGIDYDDDDDEEEFNFGT